MADREGLPANFEDLDDFRKWLHLFRVNARKGSASLTTSSGGYPETTAFAEFWNRSDMAARIDITAVTRPDGRPGIDFKLTTAATEEELHLKVYGASGQGDGSRSAEGPGQSA